MEGNSLDIKAFLSLRRQVPPPLVIDLRPTELFLRKHLAGSKSIPWQQLGEEAVFFPPKRSYLLVCDENKQALDSALAWFEQRGFSQVFYTDTPVFALLEGVAQSGDEVEPSQGDRTEWLSQIRAVVRAQVSPYLAEDQGGVEVESVQENKVYIRYTGACQTCESNRTDTLGMIQRTLSTQLNRDLKVVSQPREGAV